MTFAFDPFASDEFFKVVIFLGLILPFAFFILT